MPWGLGLGRGLLLGAGAGGLRSPWLDKAGANSIREHHLDGDSLPPTSPTPTRPPTSPPTLPRPPTSPSHSGQLVRGAPSKKPGPGGDAVGDLFDRAREAGAEEGSRADLYPEEGEEGAGGSRFFTGTGRTLAGGWVLPRPVLQLGTQRAPAHGRVGGWLAGWQGGGA